MAKRRSKDRTRDISTPIASPLRSVKVYTSPSFLAMLEDRRLFDPLRHAVAKSFVRSSSRLVVPNVARSNKTIVRSVSPAVKFSVPSHVAVCIRRKKRREVLFARGVGGSRRRQRRPRWSEFSSVNCR